MADTQEQQKIKQIKDEIPKPDVIQFFQEHFNKFCEMVEDYGEYVENCSKNPDLYVDINKRNRLEKKREKLIKKHQEYVNQEIDIDIQIIETRTVIDATQQIEVKRDIAKNNALIKSSKDKIRELNKSYKPIRRKKAIYRKKLEALPTGNEPPKEGWIEYKYDAFVYINLPFIYPKQKRNKSHGRFWITPEHVNPTMWFNDIIGFSSFSKSLTITKADKLICNAVILAVAHDKSKKSDFTNNLIYQDQEYQGKYFNRNKFCCDLWKKLQTDRIKDAYVNLEHNLDKWLEKKQKQTHENGGQGEKKKKQEKKFKAWKNPGDACFIIVYTNEGDWTKGIHFYSDGKHRNLRLRSGSRTENLLTGLKGKYLIADQIKEDMGKGRTKASNVVTFANKLLNEKIRGMDFTGVPDDYEVMFVGLSIGRYESKIPIYTRDEFHRKEIEQVTG